MMFTAALLAGIGYILFSWVNSYTTFLIVYLGVISLSFTAGSVHAPTVIANSWFIRLRARADDRRQCGSAGRRRIDHAAL